MVAPKRMIQGLVATGLVAMLAGHVLGNRIPHSVERVFRGRLIVSKAPLSPSNSRNAAIKEIKAAHIKSVKPFKNEGGVRYYTFYWTAFMYKKPPALSLSLEFYKIEGRKVASGMSANKGLTIGAPVRVLRGHTTISEDDGVLGGKTYRVKLVATVGDRDHLLAKTTLSFTK